MDQNLCYWEQADPGLRGDTPQCNPCFHLHGHRGDMKKWDGEPTSALAARARELRGRTTTTGNSLRINATPVSCGHILRQNKGLMLFHILLKRPLVHIFKKRETSTMIRARGVLPPAGWRKRIIGSLGLRGSMAWNIRPTRI